MIQSNRGSIWRKWDLQIHTPYSYLNNASLPNDFPTYLRELIGSAETSKICAVGVTDYFSIEGYTHLRRLLNDKTFTDTLDESKRKKAQEILWLPNVELRTNFLIHKSGKDSRVNMHVIFSDELTPEEIDEHFFRAVKFWDESEPQSPQNKRLLTIANLSELGKRLKQQQASFATHSDIFVGMMNAVVDANEVAQVLASHTIFHHKYLILFPSDEDLSAVSWNSQAHLSRKQCIQMSDALISSNEQTRLFGLGRKHESVEAFVREFKSLKPVISTSDAHSLEDLFKPFGVRQTWIKADVTFDGLRQILHEPEQRVFIGEYPEQLTLVRERPTQFMKLIKVHRSAATPATESWFSDFEIPLSAGLVAIIGKKGSGKSALSDLLGFTGNSSQLDYFSFLNSKRFWNDNKKRARNFEVELVWHDRKTTKRQLSAEIPPGVAEDVKYIPQNYLELICNEIDQVEASAFQRELQEVIFSHIPTEDRMGATTLDELLRLKNVSIDERLRLIKVQIHELSQQIQDMESKAAPTERARLTHLLNEKNREISAHFEGKPKPEPEASATEKEATSTAQAELTVEMTKQATAEAAHAQLVADRAVHLKALQNCAELSSALDNLELGFRNLLPRVTELATKMGLDPNQMVRLNIRRDEISQRSSEAQQHVKTIDTKLDPAIEGSEAHQLQLIKGKVAEIQKRLTDPERKRQLARQALQEWEKKQLELVGSSELPGSQKHLESRIKELDSLPSLIKDSKERRLQAVGALYDAIAELGNEYKTLFDPVETFYLKNQSELADVAVSFVVSQRVSGFSQRFLSFLDQAKRGAFRGLEEGKKVAQELVTGADFQTRDGVMKFLESVIVKLTGTGGVNVEEQIAKGRTSAELYDFLLGLDYIRPRFELLWDGKRPEQLSPGERGTLLLVFYFVLDMRTYPLIIDQPEENLDNETIYKILVPCIMFAKKRRQVVMVTHNPNLAVAADADQIIYAKVAKQGSPQLSYESGSIENPSITAHVINVLEGTTPAFRKREARYQGQPSF